MKSSVLDLCLWGSFWLLVNVITSNWSVQISLSSWLSLGRLYVSRNQSISSRLTNILVYNYLECSLMIICISVILVVTSLLSLILLIGVCCCSVAQLCLTLCEPMDCSMPDFPVPHYLPKFAQVSVHCIVDAIQPSYPLTPSSPSALNLFWHQGLFQWVSCSHLVTKILELQLQH